MAKTYILDTNVLLHDPEALFAFQENDAVIPFAVVEEIDNQKKRQDEIGRNAREVSRRLDELRVQGGLAEGVILPAGGTLRIELNHQELLTNRLGLDLDKYDNRILAVAYNLSRGGASSVILVTKDLNLRVKADVLDIPAQDFSNNRVDYIGLYSGVEELQVSTEELDTFYGHGKLHLNGQFNAMPHQFVILKNQHNSSQSALGRHTDRTLYPLLHADSVTFGIKARNKEQRFALELLMDDTVKIVTLIGRAGTGKTLLALSVGMEKVLEQKAYSRLLVTRPVIPMGDDLGYLPGSKEEKLRPWMQPIYDNLEFLLGGSPEPYQTIQHLMDTGALEMEALTYIRGRSIPNQFIICDEAQNLSPHMIKTLITRVGENTKIVFTGDPEQIDHPYLDASSNGLTVLIEKMKGEQIVGHVTLIKGERSRVAELGASLM
jgi:PhoH-like ATPase